MLLIQVVYILYHVTLLRFFFSVLRKPDIQYTAFWLAGRWLLHRMEVATHGLSLYDLVCRGLKTAFSPGNRHFSADPSLFGDVPKEKAATL